MKIETLIGRNVTLFTKKNFRFQGQVKDYDGKFIEIFDDMKQRPKLIHIDEVIEIEANN